MTNDEKELITAFATGVTEGISKNAPPIYDDLLKPTTQELGKGMAGVIKLALAPISVTVWGYDAIAKWLAPELEKRLFNVPIENIVKPKLNVIGPAIESIRFLSEETDLKEMFANLIAKSLNSETQNSVHPGYVEALKNLSAHDARLLKYIYQNKRLLWMEATYHDLNEDTLYKCLAEIDPENKNSELNLLSINNFNRLGICIPYESATPDERQELNRVQSVKNILSRDGRVTFSPRRCELTAYGEQFCAACI